MKKSKLAIASFVLSLLPIIIPIFMLIGVGIGSLRIFGYVFFYTFFVTFWFSILSIILGVIALIKIKRNNLGGKWLAIAGVVISVLLVITVTIFGFMVGWEKMTI